MPLRLIRPAPELLPGHGGPGDELYVARRMARLALWEAAQRLCLSDRQLEDLERHRAVLFPSDLQAAVEGLRACGTELLDLRRERAARASLDGSSAIAL